MRKLVLVLLFVVAVVFLFSQRYAFKGGNSPDGKYTLVLVNKTSGAIVKLLGK